MTSAATKLGQLRSQVEAARQQMKEAAQEVVKDGTKAIFADYGDIVQSFGWVQYTPYFNDGDPCTFSMGECFIVGWDDIPEESRGDNAAIQEYLDETDVRYGESPGVFSRYSDTSKVGTYRDESGGEERYREAKQAVESLYESLSGDDLAKDVFGDHVRVVFTPEGVDVDEYEHE